MWRGVGGGGEGGGGGGQSSGGREAISQRVGSLGSQPENAADLGGRSEGKTSELKER